MRTPVLAALVAVLSACSNSPQWDECSTEACSFEISGDCIARCQDAPMPDACEVGEITAEPDACQECLLWAGRDCPSECSPPPCRGGCPAGYLCANVARPFCAQECMWASDCADLDLFGHHEIVCGGSRCGVSCRSGHENEDCPPGTHCVGTTEGGGRGSCLP